MDEVRRDAVEAYRPHGVQLSTVWAVFVQVTTMVLARHDEGHPFDLAVLQTGYRYAEWARLRGLPLVLADLLADDALAAEFAAHLGDLHPGSRQTYAWVLDVTRTGRRFAATPRPTGTHSPATPRSRASH